MARMDQGLFGPDSVAWRMHADPAMLAGGMRALLVQALEPRAMAGVDQHSKFREDPWGRLRKTSLFVQRTTFGDTAEAEAACAEVRNIHDHVHGVDPVTSEHYSARDPELFLWIHAVEVHSFVIAYRSYAGRLSEEDADRYVAEMVRVAELVELPKGMAPTTMGELREYLRGVQGLQVTPAAREGLQTILSPPMPAALRPLWVVPAAAAIAILPNFARRMYGLPWFPPATMPVRVGVFALTRTMNTLLQRPPIIREARARAAADCLSSPPAAVASEPTEQRPEITPWPSPRSGPRRPPSSSSPCTRATPSASTSSGADWAAR